VQGGVASSGDASLTVESLEVDAAFRKYSRYVAAMAYRVLRNRDDVEDVVQEVFLDAVLGLSRLRDEAAVRAWLAVVTIRNATQRRRMRATSVPFEFDEEISSERLFSDGGHEHHMRLTAAAALIQALPEQLRLPWVLHCLEGMALPGVARVCGCSVATVKRRIAQARTRIAPAELSLEARRAGFGRVARFGERLP
jgi:RNA polymerase sigma-70 factor, ECF subfamily